MSEKRKSLLGIYRRQTGPLPVDEIHEFEDDWFASDLPASTPASQRILEYLKCRRRMIERMANSLKEAGYEEERGDARKAARYDCARNFQWDADTALDQIDALVALFASDEGPNVAVDGQKMFIEAIKLGKTFERLYVRRFEFWAMLGRSAKGKGGALSPDEWKLVCEEVSRLASETDAEGKRKLKVPAARNLVAAHVRQGTFPGIPRPEDIGDEMLRKEFSKYRSSLRAANDG